MTNKAIILTTIFLVIIVSVPSIYGLSLIGITENGDVISIRSTPFASDNDSDGTGDGKSMIDGMGIGSRINQNEYDGKITHGTGNIGEDNSLVPYIVVGDDTDFVGLVDDNDRIETVVIDEFWKQYDLSSGNLVDETPQIDNILTYSNSKVMQGSVSTSVTNNGIVFSGDGIIILKLDKIDDNIVLRGTLNKIDVKIVSSPLDLTTLSMLGDNYNLYSTSSPSLSGYSSTQYWHESGCRQGGCYGYYYYTTSGTYTSYPNLTVSSDTDLISDTTITYTTYQGSSSVSATTTPSTSTVSNGKTITTLSAPFSYTVNHYPTESIAVSQTIKSTTPWNEQLQYTNNFEQVVAIPLDTYMIITLNDGKAVIKGEPITDETNFIEITGMDANIPFNITKDGYPIITGMTDSDGTIIINNIENIPSIQSGILYYYPDSLSYRGSFSTVVLDKLNDETIHLDSVNDIVYTVHAYAAIPVTGTVEITNLSLVGDSTLSLDYLNGNYTTGNTINVPVIPKYDRIDLDINNLSTSLYFSDILGGSGIKVIESETSNISKKNINSRLSSIEAIVGTTSYVIASSDGEINAIVTETISGTVFISNSYTLDEIPPEPPKPPRRDPLSGWVDVYVNGDFVKQVSLGINPYPDFTGSMSVSDTAANQSVRYSYPDYVVTGGVSIDVESGDYIEFYLYAKIHGGIDGYTAPSGYKIVNESGYGTATVNISSAIIQTSMS